MQSEFNSQVLAGACSKNLENLFWTCTGTKKKGTKGFKKNLKVVPASRFDGLPPAVWTSGFDNDIKISQPSDCILLSAWDLFLQLCFQ